MWRRFVLHGSTVCQALLRAQSAPRVAVQAGVLPSKQCVPLLHVECCCEGLCVPRLFFDVILLMIQQPSCVAELVGQCAHDLKFNFRFKSEALFLGSALGKDRYFPVIQYMKAWREGRGLSRRVFN